MGVLAALYGAGSMAYVGGGFGRAGLHSVLEPAAWGVPVAFGPRWGESRDAALLLRSRWGRGDRESAGTPARHWRGGGPDGWMNEEERAAQGARARAVVEAGRGASRRSAAMLADAISSRPLRTSPTAGRCRPEREPGDEHVGPAAANPDPEVGHAAASRELSGERLPERRLLVLHQSPESEDRLRR